MCLESGPAETNQAINRHRLAVGVCAAGRRPCVQVRARCDMFVCSARTAHFDQLNARQKHYNGTGMIPE